VLLFYILQASGRCFHTRTASPRRQLDFELLQLRYASIQLAESSGQFRSLLRTPTERNQHDDQDQGSRRQRSTDHL